MHKNDKNVLSVSQLNRQAKQALEHSLPNVCVQGELTNFAQPGSGHWYFTLKDAKAQVKCAMFRGRNIMVREPLKAGDQVVVNASVSLYEGRGDYQLIVDSLQKAGLGDLHQQYEALKSKLTEEGVFASDYKQTLPSYPRCIGIISSPTGAAVHDMLTVLKHRYPCADVIIYPAVVQGNDAPLSLRQALARANAQDKCDVLIIGRGGGSLEDLWAFNNEHLVREVHSSIIPVVSAVGHEVDITLCDFAADLRAPTPSAAAEAVTPDINELTSLIQHCKAQLLRAVHDKLQQAQQQLLYYQSRLTTPAAYVQQQQQRLDYLSLQLQQTMQERLNDKRDALTMLQHRLQLHSPTHSLREANNHCLALRQRLQAALEQKFAEARQRLSHQVALLNIVSPLQTLQRGYSITQTQQGQVISSIKHVKLNQPLQIGFTDGSVGVTVEQVSAKPFIASD